MIMIRHETIRNNHRAVLLIILLYEPQKILVIPIVEEYLSLSRTAVVYMVILTLRENITSNGMVPCQNVPQV